MWKKNGIILGILLLAFMIYQYGEYIYSGIGETLSVNTEADLEDMEEENQNYIEEDDVLETQIVLDAGHGGADPGMVGINQALEKDINLAIAQKVYDLLVEEGYQVAMTRVDDNGMDASGEMSKTEDLEARVELINEEKPTLAVSIHQNSYSDENVHGAQVFYYSSSEEGAVAAQIMQDALLAVDEDNTRKIESNSTYYLLNRTEVPTIIVECGFLSNASEADLLIEEEYQQQIAIAITSGIIEYLERSVL